MHCGKTTLNNAICPVHTHRALRPAAAAAAAAAAAGICSGDSWTGQQIS